MSVPAYRMFESRGSIANALTGTSGMPFPAADEPARRYGRGDFRHSRRAESGREHSPIRQTDHAHIVVLWRDADSAYCNVRRYAADSGCHGFEDLADRLHRHAFVARPIHVI